MASKTTQGPKYNEIMPISSISPENLIANLDEGDVYKKSSLLFPSLEKQLVKNDTFLATKPHFKLKINILKKY